MSEDIKTLNDLYKRIRPAMYVKLKDIRRDYGIDVTYEELFYFLQNKMWKGKNNLSLMDIVNDIFNLNINDLFSYIETRRKNGQNEETI